MTKRPHQVPIYLHTALDAHMSPPLSFENSQQIPRDPINKKTKPQLAKRIPPTSPFDALSSTNLQSSQLENPQLNQVKPPTSQLDVTSSQNPNFSLPRLISRLR